MKNYSLKLKTSLKTILVFFLIVTFNFTLLTFNLRQADASSFSLSVAPTTIEARMENDTPYQASIQLENKENESIGLTISYHSFKPNQTTTNEIIFDNKDLPIFKNVKVLDDSREITSLTLGPKQKKTLSLYIDSLFDAKSDSYFSVVFESSPELATQNTSVLVSSGVAVNVLVSGTAEATSGSLEEFSAPLFVQKGPVTFKIRVKNTSNHFIVAQGAILIKNMFGQTIGNLVVDKTRILGNTDREITVVWNEKFLLGMYNAAAQVSLGENGPVYTRTIRFLAVPFYLVLGIILFAISLAYILKRVKKRQTTI